MKRKKINPISKKQSAELSRRRKLKAKLLLECKHDSAGFPLCMKCEIPADFRGLQLVHLIPLSAGGKTNKKNCRVWCASCHGGNGKGGHGTEIKSKPEKPIDRACELSGYHGLRPAPKPGSGKIKRKVQEANN